MWIFQVAMALFAVFMLYVLRIHFKKQHLSSMEYGLWVLIWLGFIMLSLSPSLLQGVADVLHIGRVFDLLIVFAFLILTVVSITTRLSVLASQQKLAELTRLLALQSARLEIERNHAATTRSSKKR